MIPVFLELTVYLSMICATGGNTCLQHQDNGYTMVVYLWDLNVDFINWYLAPETVDSACPTWDLLTRLIVNRTNYQNWILTKPCSPQSANPIERRTATTLSNSYFLLRQSHLLMCSWPQTPDCIWCPWTGIICPEGDLHHRGFLLKNGFQPTWGKLKGQEAQPRPVGRPPSRCQSPETEGDCLQMASSFGTAGEWPCGRHDRPHSAKAVQSSPPGQNVEEKTCQILAERLCKAFHALYLNLSSCKMRL